jgi:hypothetical protein
MANGEKGQGSGNAFDDLASAMPRIAEAVKDLPESVQGKAFDALVAAFTSGAAPASPNLNPTARESRRAARRKKATPAKTGTPGRRTSHAMTISKDLNLAPGGKKSFKLFAEEKRPTTQHDRSVVSVYWLEQIAGHSPISVSDVYTCYRHAGWKVPSNMSNGLAVTANRKGFFDTSDLRAIRLKAHGINRVEQDLPKAQKA